MTEDEILEALAAITGETPERIRTVAPMLLRAVREGCPETTEDVAYLYDVATLGLWRRKEDDE